jgi:paired amphipathic helix protein Sin3a
MKYAIGKKRYMLFKSSLLLSLKAKDFKYEDYLRSIFGK